MRRNELPSNDPVELGLQDTERNRRLLRVFIDANKHAEVFNYSGGVGEMLLGLAVQFGLSLRVVELERVGDVESMQETTGIKPYNGHYRRQDLEDRKPGFVINGIDPFILNNPARFPSFEDLDNAMQVLTLAAHHGGVMILTHTQDLGTYRQTTRGEIHRISQGSYWLQEFLFRRFQPKIIE